MKEIICIIGLGEIGGELLQELHKKCAVSGCDINGKKVKQFAKKGYNVSKKIQKSDIYIISVYHSGDVLKVIKKIDYSNKPLVIIESTLKPGTVEKIKKFKEKKGLEFNLVLFPHRHNRNDPEHQFFNLDRILGGLSKECEKKAIGFYSKFMPKKLIHVFPVETVELAKPMENAYRFFEIAFAEELKMLCGKKGIDFNMLRKAMNTKWNIIVKEAREGINGKCLPKDTLIINDFFAENQLIDMAIKIDKKYKRFRKSKPG